MVDFNWSEATKGVEGMVNSFVSRLPYLLLGLIAFLIIYYLGKVVRRLIQKITRRHEHHKNVGVLLGRLAQGATVAMALLVAAVIAIPSFQPGQLVQLLGIGSVAIGFAFRDILQNFLAGILLLLTQPFRLGDQIKVNDFEGTVEDIQTRATSIRTYDGRRIIIPNSDLFTDAVTVNTAFDKRRVSYDVGIGYGDDPERAKQVIVEAIRGLPEVLKEPPPEALVVELAASAVMIRVRWWICPPNRRELVDTRDKVLLAIKTAFGKAGIDLPYPTQQILFHDQTEETDGNRKAQREGWAVGNGSAPRRGNLASALHRLADLQESGLKKRSEDSCGREGSRDDVERMDGKN
ncbi:MAG: mechanosensitive ion channel family protein [Verrucomicrobiota bacterium]|nr:mechanosensitive ion channel family protein [Verrucomicrobiota bacterium]